MHSTSRHGLFGVRRALAGTLLAASLFTLASPLPGCGGGGGGGGGGGPPAPPGTLAAIALEGTPAPGTTGTFGAFTTSTKLDVCDDGTAVYVSTVTGGPVPEALFATLPDGTQKLVYAVGDLLPDSTPGTGTITGFERIFVRTDLFGTYVVALVTGTDPTEGVVAARIDGLGDVVEKAGVLYLGDTLNSSPVGRGGVTPTAPGTLNDIDAVNLDVTDHGETFFHGVGSSLHGIWSVSRDGTVLTNWATQLDLIANDPNQLGGGFATFGVDADGSIIGFQTTVLGGVGPLALFAADTSQVLMLARDFQAAPGLPAPRNFIQSVAFGPIDVSYAATTGFISWTARLTGGSPDLAVYTVQVAPTLGTPTPLIFPTEAAPAYGVGAVVGDSGLLAQEHDPNYVTIRSTILGGTTNEVFFASSGPGSLLEIWHQGTSAPGGGAFTNTYASLLQTNPVQHADNVSSLAVVANTTTPVTAVFWGISGSDIFRIAILGGSAPNTSGGTFASFGVPALLTTATDVVVFRAAIAGGSAASGLFRQH